MILLRSTIASPEGERRELEVVAASFEQGCVEIDELIPEGWREVSIVVGRA